jgi:hypothetical protein
MKHRPWSDVRRCRSVWHGGIVIASNLIQLCSVLSFGHHFRRFTIDLPASSTTILRWPVHGLYASKHRHGTYSTPPATKPCHRIGGRTILELSCFALADRFAPKTAMRVIKQLSLAGPCRHQNSSSPCANACWPAVRKPATTSQAPCCRSSVADVLDMQPYARTFRIFRVGLNALLFAKN